MERLQITAAEDPNWRERLVAFLDKNKDKSIHIYVTAYDIACSKCGQPIPPGKETEYGGRTMCFKCAEFEEETDEECN